MKYIRAYVIQIEYSEKYEIREAKSCRTFIFASRLPSAPTPYFLFPMKTHIYYKNRRRRFATRRLHSIFELRRYFSLFVMPSLFFHAYVILRYRNCSILVFRFFFFIYIRFLEFQNCGKEYEYEYEYFKYIKKYIIKNISIYI